MNIAIIYDSIYGNTAQVAKAIATGLDRGHEVKLVTVQEAMDLDLSGTDLLVIGSPTRGFQPTPNILEFIAALGPAPEGLTAAVFDTRLDPETISPLPLRWVVEVGGYAATRMASGLRSHGIELRGDPEAFLVTGTEGPLKAGELERAREWARGLLVRQPRTAEIESIGSASTRRGAPDPGRPS